MASVSGTPVAPKKKGRPRLLQTATMATPTVTSAAVTVPAASSTANAAATNANATGGGGSSASTVIVSNANNSPKARFPNNPVLKKKLLGLQKFLSEYIVSLFYLFCFYLY